MSDENSRNTKHEYNDKEWIVENYEGADGSLSIREMAEIAEVNPSSMRMWAKEYGVYKGTVTCLECGEKFKQITNTHVQRHDLTIEEYKEKYPDAGLGDNRAWEVSGWHRTGQPNPMKGVTGSDHPRTVERVDVECDNCGRIKKIRVSEDDSMHNFCDRECYLEWKAKNRRKKERVRYPSSYEEQRLIALERDGHACRLCGSEEQLHVHHVIPSRKGGNSMSYNLSTLCASCHKTIEPPGLGCYTEVTRKVGIDSGHRLFHHDFKCQNLHGHRYEIELTAAGLIDRQDAMIWDFSDIKEIMWDILDEDIDHGMLLNEEDSEVVELCEENDWRYRTMNRDPTVENISDWLFWQFDQLADNRVEDYRARWRFVGITVHETPNCKATGDYR